MIRLNKVRMSFRNYRGSPRSAERVARQAMEHLERMSGGDARPRWKSRTLDRIECGPLRISPGGASDEALAHMVASHAWRSIRESIR